MNCKDYVFGPVPSRRLGFSLGIDLVPFKVCSFDCIYCQIGKTTDKLVTRKSYCPYEAVIQELKEKLREKSAIDYITFSGSGEPTLSSDIGKVIIGIKNITNIPVAVLTNSSLLYRTDVKRDLDKVDLLVPSLDAVTDEVLEKINRPFKRISVKQIREGLIDIKNWFKGEVRLEIILVKGVNDTTEQLDLMLDWVAEIKPDKVELNTVTRPPSEVYAQPVERERLTEIAQKFGEVASVIKTFSHGKQNVKIKEARELICNTLLRRPLNKDDLINITGLEETELNRLLSILQEKKLIRQQRQDKDIYYFMAVEKKTKVLTRK